MAVKGIILMKDADGNDLKGPREDGSSLVLDFTFNAQVPHDSHGKIQGQRRVLPFSVTKEIDQLTPQIFKGLCRNEIFTGITVNLFRIEPETGLEKNYFSYLFTKAHIVNIINSMPSITENDKESVGQLETVSFVAEEITLVFKEGNIEYTDKPALHFQT
ncbi:MAG: type VI secretion system tube protein TssD [Ignavibacteria bacterium]